MNLPLNTDLTGKVAVVTGAAGTLCSVFSQGAGCERREGRAAGTYIRQRSEAGGRDHRRGRHAKAYECNVLDKAAVMACHEQVLADFGPATSSSTAQAATTPAPQPTRNITSRAIWTPPPRAFSIWTRRALLPFSISTSWGFSSPRRRSPRYGRARGLQYYQHFIDERLHAAHQNSGVFGREIRCVELYAVAGGAFFQGRHPRERHRAGLLLRQAECGASVESGRYADRADKENSGCDPMGASDKRKNCLERCCS